MNPVATYCQRYRASGLSPRDFAYHMWSHEKDMCWRILDIIGSWPSSEPELAALQRECPSRIHA